MASTSNAAASPLTPVYECDFEITTKGLREVPGKVATEQSNELGITGWVEEVRDGVYKGHLEGSHPSMAIFKQIIEAAFSEGSSAGCCPNKGPNCCDKKKKDCSANCTL